MFNSINLLKRQISVKKAIESHVCFLRQKRIEMNQSDSICVTVNSCRPCLYKLDFSDCLSFVFVKFYRYGTY